jgi:hypothetical protein
MVSVTTEAGKLSIQPATQRHPTGPANARGLDQGNQGNPQKKPRRQEEQTGSGVPGSSLATTGPLITKRATRSNTADITHPVPLPMGKASAPTVAQKGRKGKKRTGKV